MRLRVAAALDAVRKRDGDFFAWAYELTNRRQPERPGERLTRCSYCVDRGWVLVRLAVTDDQRVIGNRDGHMGVSVLDLDIAHGSGGGHQTTCIARLTNDVDYASDAIGHLVEAAVRDQLCVDHAGADCEGRCAGADEFGGIRRIDVAGWKERNAVEGG